MTLTRRLQLVENPSRDAELEAAVQVAFTTSDLRHVDQHFGSAQALVLYAVTPERSQMVAASQFGRLDQDGNEDKLAAKLKTLEGCVAVYTQAVGASAIGQLKTIGVQAIKVAPGSPIAELVKGLQQEMRLGPDSWVAQAIRRQQPVDPRRFDAMAEESWAE